MMMFNRFIITWHKLYSLSLAILFFSVHAIAQDDYELSPIINHEDFNVHINAIVGIPSKELKEAVQNKFGNVGVGLSAGVYINPLMGQKKQSLILPGIDFSYLMYGIDWIDKTANNPALKTIFNYYTIQGGFRVLPSQYKSFSPYIDGLLGTKIFNTKTKVRNEGDIINSTNEAGVNYGLGVGFYTRKPDALNQPVSFNLRLLYFWGANTKYVVRNSFSFDQNNNLTFETARTRTNMLTIQIGIIIH